MEMFVNCKYKKMREKGILKNLFYYTCQQNYINIYDGKYLFYGFKHKVNRFGVVRTLLIIMSLTRRS